MIKGIIFDVDGTLLDSMQIWNEIGTRYLKKKNINAEPGLNTILFSMSFEEGCLYLNNQYNLTRSAQEIADEIIKQIEDFYLYEAKLKVGVKEFLQKMKAKAVPMIIATSNDKNILKHSLEKLGIMEYFTDIIACTELKTSKRTPDIYLHCARIIGTEPGETLVFEDVMYGIKSAKDAGFITVGVEDFSSMDDKAEIKALADYYIKDFTEIGILNI